MGPMSRRGDVNRPSIPRPGGPSRKGIAGEDPMTFARQNAFASSFFGAQAAADEHSPAFSPSSSDSAFFLAFVAAFFWGAEVNGSPLASKR
jgi:hypothetical protein